jgi:hypothetical protein
MLEVKKKPVEVLIFRPGSIEFCQNICIQSRDPVPLNE